MAKSSGPSLSICCQVYCHAFETFVRLYTYALHVALALWKQPSMGVGQHTCVLITAEPIPVPCARLGCRRDVRRLRQRDRLRCASLGYRTSRSQPPAQADMPAKIYCCTTSILLDGLLWFLGSLAMLLGLQGLTVLGAAGYNDVLDDPTMGWCAVSAD